MFRNHRWWLVAISLSVTLAAAACGSSSSAKNSTSTNGPVTTATSSATSGGSPSGAPIVVGSICSCSGAESVDLSGMPALLMAWQDATNAGGGINGHPVKVIVKDDALNPALGLQEAKELVTQDHVMAIIGDSSLVDTVFAPYLQSVDVPVVGGSTANGPFSTNSDFFRSGTAETAGDAGIEAEIKQVGGTHLGVMYCAEAPQCALQDAAFQAIAKIDGLGYSTETVSATAPNFTAQCLNFKNGGVDSVVIVDSHLVNARIADDCATIGYKPKWFANTGGFGDNYLTDANLNGTYLVIDNAFDTDSTIPGVKTFLDALDTYAPGLKRSPQFNNDLTYVWAGAELFQAAAMAGNITPTSTGADVKKALYSLTNETLRGLAPPLTFSSTASIPAYPSCYFEFRVLGGKYVAQNDDKAQCLSAAVVAAIHGAGYN